MVCPTDPQVLLWPESRQCGPAGEPGPAFARGHLPLLAPGAGVPAEHALRRASRAQPVCRKSLASEPALGEAGEGGAGAGWGPMAPASTSSFLAGENLREGPDALLW